MTKKTGWLAEWWHGTTKRLPLRRGLVLLIVAALLPITILSILQGMVRLENRRAAVIYQLSESAEALADSNQAILDATETLIRVTAMNPVVAAGGPACSAVLADIRDITPALANIILYDSDGRLKCAAQPPVNRYVIPDRNWWALVKSRQSALISDALWGTFSKRRVVMMVAPLHDKSGAFTGAVAASIDLAWLKARLRTRIDTDDTGVAIVSDSGQVLMSSRPLPAFDLATPAGSIGRTRDADGTRWSYTLVPLVKAQPGQNGLYVAYADPEPPRFGFVWWQTIFDFALPVLAIMLASLAIWISTQRLVLRWLLALQRLALHFAGGDYRHRQISFAEAPREIRSVAASLYRMSAAVSERDRRVRDSLERQRLLAREVHHRVKNNFQVVMSMLSLQSARLADPAARNAIDQARRRISALALVHRLLYDTGELASISSRTLLGALCDQLQPAKRAGVTLELHCDFDDVLIDIDSAVPLTLWLVETVNNAFHHGFPPPRGGAVTATFRVHDEGATLMVTDNGIGFDPRDPPADLPGGYGLRLIKALAAQLGGTAAIEQRPQGGCAAILHFPLKALIGPLESGSDEDISLPA